jgi:hypothetical protein
MGSEVMDDWSSAVDTARVDPLTDGAPGFLRAVYGSIPLGEQTARHAASASVRETVSMPGTTMVALAVS